MQCTVLHMISCVSHVAKYAVIVDTSICVIYFSKNTFVSILFFIISYRLTGRVPVSTEICEKSCTSVTNRLILGNLPWPCVTPENLAG